MDRRTGQRVDGFVLERLLGRGGMSSVYLGREEATGQPVAVKILHGDLPDRIEADRRLKQEAKAISRIQHPNVVRVFGMGTTSDGRPYIAMEYLVGATLSDRVRAGHPLPIPQALHIVQQMLSALAAAHALEIIHRDIKPDNVFLVERDGDPAVVKMLDFGIAKLLGVTSDSVVVTVRGVVLGTPEYLPPEIAMDLSVSRASDLYSVGVILFELLTGQLPFSGRGPAELAEHHCFTPAPRLRRLNAHVPPELEAVVLRCLEKDPNDRYQRAEDLAQALQPFCDSNAASTVVSTPVTPAPLNDPQADPAELDGIERALRRDVQKHWADSSDLPAALAHTLSELDGLRARLEEIGTELALVHDRIAESATRRAQADSGLLDALAEDESVAEDLRQTRRSAQDLAERLAARELRSGETLRALIGRSPTGGAPALQDVLSAQFVHRIAPQLAEDEECDRQEKALGELMIRLGGLTEQRAQLVTQRARIEAEVLMQRARHTAARLQLQAQLDSLEARRAGLRRKVASNLSRCAVDLAVILGA